MIELFLRWNGKPCDFDGVFGFQCVDIIKQYFKDVLGLPVFSGNAIDYWVDIPGFTRIKKTWFNRPEPGDLVIFNIKPYGHIAIVNWARMFDLGVFEQNSPIGSPCHYTDYPNYKDIIGWQRPDYLPDRTDTKPRKSFEDPVKLFENRIFTMEYTCFNAEPEIMEMARKSFLEYSKGKIDVSFRYTTVPTIYAKNQIITQDELYNLLKTYPVSTPFAFIEYEAKTPNYDYMVTYEVPGTETIVTASEPVPNPDFVVFELAHAISKYLQKKGFQIDVLDVYTPDSNFIRRKFEAILPLVDKLLD